MTPKIRESIDNLVDALRKESSETAVSFRLFVNYEGQTIEVEERTAEGLKAAGISMRNLRGDFIRPMVNIVK